MKIVVNRCFGGFGLSALAEKEYLAKRLRQPIFTKGQSIVSKMAKRGISR